MTVHQELVQHRDDGDGGPPSWEDAPAPAQVARRLIGLTGRDVPPARIPLLTNVMHWGYGIAWGGVYGLLRPHVRIAPPAAGPLFGAAVWASSYAELVPLGIYEPPWAYSAGELANDLGYHLSYGTGVAATYALLDD
jgi:hypothetical protein